MVFIPNDEALKALNFEDPVSYPKKQLLSYPLDRADRVKSRIKFNPVVIEPADISFRERLSAAFTPASDRRLSDSISEQTDDVKNSVLSEKFKNDLSKVQNSNLGTLKTSFTSDVVNIYTPISLQYNDGVVLNLPTSLNIGGALTGQALASGQDLISASLAGLGQAAKGIFDLISTGTINDAAAVTATRLVDAIPGLNSAANATRVALQVTANPNSRAVFGGVKLRSFTFQFKFIPVSQEESIEVQNIITFFKKEMYPEHIVLGSIPYGYKFPNLFRIAVQYDVSGSGDFTSMPNMEIGLCYLSDVATTYNPTGGAYHPDGRPNEIDMSLVFSEYRTRSKADVGNANLGTEEAQGFTI